MPAKSSAQHRSQFLAISLTFTLNRPDTAGDAHDGVVCAVMGRKAVVEGQARSEKAGI